MQEFVVSALFHLHGVPCTTYNVWIHHIMKKFEIEHIKNIFIYVCKHGFIKLDLSVLFRTVKLTFKSRKTTLQKFKNYVARKNPAGICIF